MRSDLHTGDPPQQQPVSNSLGRHLEGDLIASLMRRHQVAAERLIGWLRVTIGMCIFSDGDRGSCAEPMDGVVSRAV